MQKKSNITPKDVLNFWFEEIDQKMWTTQNEKFNKEVIIKFNELHEEIISDKRKVWENDAKGSLALILVLDQFSIIFENTPKAYKSDKFALKIAKNAIKKGFDKKIQQERKFFYYPFMHSEAIANQEKAVELFTQLAKDERKDIEAITEKATENRYIIRKFQRFPQRNKILNRESTFAEKEFLKTL